MGGRLSKVDALKAQKDYAGARLMADSAELGFDQFRVQCAILDKEEEAYRKRKEEEDNKRFEESMKHFWDEDDDDPYPDKALPPTKGSRKSVKPKPDGGCSYLPGDEDCSYAPQCGEGDACVGDAGRGQLCEAYGTCEDERRTPDCSEADKLLGICGRDRHEERCPLEGGDCGDRLDVPRELEGFVPGEGEIPDVGAIPGAGKF